MKSLLLAGAAVLWGPRPFAGAVLHLRQGTGLMAEWDSRQFNLGAFATLWKRWTLQAGLLDGRQLTFGTSYAVSLLSTKPQSAHEMR